MAVDALVAWGRTELIPVLNTNLEAQIEAPRNGRARRLHVEIETAPGVGNTILFTLLVNGIASTISVLIAGVATAGDDLVNQVTIAEGDVLAMAYALSPSAAQPGKVRADMSFD